MTAKTIQNYTKTVKTALSGKIGKVCVTVCFYNAKEWIFMFSPILRAHGSIGSWSCSRCPPAPRSTWSSHMVRSHGLQHSMTFKDYELDANFLFLCCNAKWKMCVNIWFYYCLNILLWILQKVQLVWSRIIGSSAILDFRIWNFLSSIFVYKLVLPVSHIGFYISFFFPYFKLKCNWVIQINSI